jgi:L-tartrate/succinate antiporter
MALPPERLGASLRGTLPMGAREAWYAPPGVQAGVPTVVPSLPPVGGPPRDGRIARAIIPVAVGAAIALWPAPEGLAPAAWLYFALFVTVIVGVITEPIPAAALGLAGVALAAALGLVRDTPAQSAQWALSGFGNTIVWLIFAAYMFTLGYAQTGLGRRIALHLVRLLGRRTLGLGYAVTFADLALAPFTPSATARSGGTIYPIIRHIPELYDSRPDDGTARRIGAYVLYTAVTASAVTSSMFITGLAPNALAIGIIEGIIDVRISWVTWFVGFAPVGFALLVCLPLVLYLIYPPDVRTAPEVPRWASEQLQRLGAMSEKEMVLLALVGAALALWIGAADYVDPAIVAILILLLMIGFRVVAWDDVLKHAAAWNVLVWFGTLVTLAGGLAETGFVEWVAGRLTPAFAGVGLSVAIVALVGSFFFLHYFFASITAHTATLLPVFLTLALTIPGMSDVTWALLFGYSLGLMGVLTSYASGQIVIYYGSGYISRRDVWLLGLVTGVFFLIVYLAIIVPWLRWLQI